MNLDNQRLIDQAINETGGKWPSGAERCRVRKTIITREEFEARKADRQNSPSWDKAPDWAHWRAQDSRGAWWWYPGCISAPVIGTESFVNQSVDRVIFAGSGQVIGDWRNTLEQRQNHIGESDEKGDVDAAIEAMRDIRTAFANQAVSQFKTSARYVDKHPCGLSKVEVTVEPDIDFEWLANQFDDADDINAVWALRDKLHHKNKPEPSPELSFHLSNAFNELQASARLLPEDDPRRASIVSLAGGVSAVKEVA